MVLRKRARELRYDVKIKYMRGPEMYLADALSRAYLRIYSVNFLSISEPQIQEIREETAKVPAL